MTGCQRGKLGEIGKDDAQSLPSANADANRFPETRVHFAGLFQLFPCKVGAGGALAQRIAEPISACPDGSYVTRIRTMPENRKEATKRSDPMAMQRKAWMPIPATKSKSTLPGTAKDDVATKARDLIETAQRAKHVTPPAQDERFNCITDITVKWLGSKCYFNSIYACPGPNALASEG